MHGGDIYNNKIEYDFSVNVNPFGPYDNVVNAVKNTASKLDVYPEYRSLSLRKKIADLHGISANHICVTNGASEAISAIIKSQIIDDVIIEIPSFYGYEHSIKQGQKLYAYSRNSILKLNENMIKKNSLLVFANPANPTGDFTDIFKLEPLYKRVKNADAYMMVDESFLPICDYRDRSLINRIKEDPDYYNRLIIVRSFTKSFSIPAIRLGYFISGDAVLVNTIEKSLPEWNVSLPAQVAGEQCLIASDKLQNDVIRIKALRNKLVRELSNLGIKCYNSCTNYILFVERDGLYEKLLKKGILIRDCSDYRGIDEIKKEIICQNMNGEISGGRGMGIYRIAVKTQEENDIFIEALRNVLKD